MRFWEESHVFLERKEMRLGFLGRGERKERKRVKFF